MLVLQVVAVAVLASFAAHDGVLFYQGGDQLWYWTGAWLIGDGWLPPTVVGYTWTFALVPLAAITGPNFLVGGAVLAVVQPLTLVPLTTVLMYAAGKRIAGSWAGAWAAGVWAFVPFLAIPLFVVSYHDRWVDQFLPQLGGLSALADLPATVCLLGAAVATLRALDRPVPVEGALAGALAGIALGIKPSNALFIAAPLAALAAAQAWRAGVAFVLALIPSVATLALWKLRVLGELPAFAPGEPAAPTNPITRYLDLDWSHLHQNLVQLNDVFLIPWVLALVPFAGTFVLLRWSVPKALLVSLWFWAFLLGKGTAHVASVQTGSFWRLLMPALPAYALLLASLPLLIPRVRARVSTRQVPPAPLTFIRFLAAASVIVILVPLAAIMILRPLDDPRAIALEREVTLVPVVDSLALHATHERDQLLLSWRMPEALSTRPYFRLFHTESEELDCSEAGARNCLLRRLPVANLVGTRAMVPFQPGTYRLGFVANWLGEVGAGETLMLGPPLVIRK